MNQKKTKLLWQAIQEYGEAVSDHCTVQEYACSRQEEDAGEKAFQQAEQILRDKIGEITGWYPIMAAPSDFDWSFIKYESFD